MAEFDLSRIEGADGNNYNIKAKALESQITIGGASGGDVSGTTTSDLGSNTTFTLTIGEKKVTTAKIADSAVTTDKVNDKAITLDKIADAARGGSVADNDGVLATHAQVKTAIDNALTGKGSYKGKQTVATINTWTAANLNNGDHVIVSDSGTLTLGSLAVRAGEDVIFWKPASGSAVWQSMDGDFKLKQTAKSDPTASGTTLTVIATLSQDANGEISATKKTIQDATTAQKGVMKVGTGLSASSGTVSVSYGTAAGTACQGNDSRLSDSRTPKAHSHTISDVTNLTESLKSKADRDDVASEDRVASGMGWITTEPGDIVYAPNGGQLSRAVYSEQEPGYTLVSTTVAKELKNRQAVLDIGYNILSFDLVREALLNKFWPRLYEDLSYAGGSITERRYYDYVGFSVARAVTTYIFEFLNGGSSVRITVPSVGDIAKANVQYAEYDHTHGNISSDGKLGTASRVVVTDSNKNVDVSETTSTELGYVHGVTSAIQTQLNGKEPSFEIKYNATNKSLVFSKAFGTV